MDQIDLWQVVPRQVVTPYDCLLISVGLVVLCPVGCLGVTGVPKYRTLYIKYHYKTFINVKILNIGIDSSE